MVEGVPSSYRVMWIFVMFDLPVSTRKERGLATMFRNNLLDIGFEMSQFSIYLKYCRTAEKAESIVKKVKRRVPRGGKVDILSITDKQFSNIVRLESGDQAEMSGEPAQLQIF
jgi:CRISPR-associated protein Cas2